MSLHFFRFVNLIQYRTRKNDLKSPEYEKISITFHTMIVIEEPTPEQDPNNLEDILREVLFMYGEDEKLAALRKEDNRIVFFCTGDNNDDIMVEERRLGGERVEFAHPFGRNLIDYDTFKEYVRGLLDTGYVLENLN